MSQSARSIQLTQNTLQIKCIKLLKLHVSSSTRSSLVLLLLPFWDPPPVVFPELWPVETASLREQLEVVSLRFRVSPLKVESLLLQAPPAPGNTHRLWLFNRPRHGGPFSGDSWKVTRDREKHLRLNAKFLILKSPPFLKDPLKMTLQQAGLRQQHSSKALGKHWLIINRDHVKNLKKAMNRWWTKHLEQK